MGWFSCFFSLDPVGHLTTVHRRFRWRRDPEAYFVAANPDDHDRDVFADHDFLVPLPAQD